MKALNTLVFISTAGFALLFAAPQRLAMAESQEQSTTQLTLGSSSGAPDSSVIVPVYLIPAPGVHIARLGIEITYVSVNFKFETVDPGLVVEESGVTLKAELRNARDATGIERETLTIDVSSQGKAIPSGLLAYLTFSVGPNARPATITLQPAVAATELGTGKPVKPISAVETQVEIVGPGSEPMVSCFFFTH